MGQIYDLDVVEAMESLFDADGATDFSWVPTIALMVCLVFYNLLANRWPPFNRALYVPMNLALGAAVVAFGWVALDVGRRDIFGAAAPYALEKGILMGAVVAAPLFLALIWPRTAKLVADERVGHLAGAGLLYQVLIRIPLGTAALEEVAFRGVVFSALRDLGDVQAALVSSITFGLWHIGPTINLVRANRSNASVRTIVSVITGAVLFTTAAGLVFVWMRLETNLVGAIALHATVNGLGTLAAVLARRRLGLGISSPR